MVLTRGSKREPALKLSLQKIRNPVWQSVQGKLLTPSKNWKAIR